MKLFADDAKLYTEIQCESDISNLNECACRLVGWAKAWQLNIAINKCCTLDIFQNKHLAIEKVSFLDDTALERLSKIRDLGVVFDQKLKFGEHISMVVANAKQRMSLLLRCFKTKDPFYLMIGFKSFILPLVEYCSPVWSPHLVKDVLLVESVQRVFTKRIPALKGLTYSQRINFLGIQTLERRRLENDLVTCFKILNGFLSGPPEAYGLSLSKRRSRGHSLKLAMEQPKVDARKFYFSYRVARPWNSLTESIVNSVSVKSFKKNLQDIKFDEFLMVK